MDNRKISIIGGGNLGISIAEGLLKSRYTVPENIIVTRRRLHLINHLKEKGVRVTDNNIDAVTGTDLVIVAVKPHQVKNLLHEIKSKLDPARHILISVVTGVSIREIQEIINKDVALFLAMPNTAIAIQESMTCIATNNTTEEQQQIILGLFDQLGKAIIINEELMEAATVLGACGIAYALRFIRASSQGGIEIGFSSKVAQMVAAQTVKGAAGLLIEGGQHPEYEIDKVTTPQGCTIAGLNEMEHQGFSSALIKGITTSYNKISNIVK